MAKQTRGVRIDPKDWDDIQKIVEINQKENPDYKASTFIRWCINKGKEIFWQSKI